MVSTNETEWVQTVPDVRAVFHIWDCMLSSRFDCRPILGFSAELKAFWVCGFEPELLHLAHDGRHLNDARLDRCGTDGPELAALDPGCNGGGVALKAGC